jgi:hypothetical protein
MIVLVKTMALIEARKKRVMQLTLANSRVNIVTYKVKDFQVTVIKTLPCVHHTNLVQEIGERGLNLLFIQTLQSSKWSQIKNQTRVYTLTASLINSIVTKRIVDSCKSHL